MSSSSESVSLASERGPRLVALDGSPRPYIVEAGLDVGEGTEVEQLVQLYWAVQGMRPVLVDVDDDRLHGRFHRYAPSADVAAWALADELRALQGARLTTVAVRPADDPETELVLTKTTKDAGIVQEAAA